MNKNIFLGVVLVLALVGVGLGIAALNKESTSVTSSNPGSSESRNLGGSTADNWTVGQVLTVNSATTTFNGRTCVTNNDSYIDASTTLHALPNNFGAPAEILSYSSEQTGAATSSYNIRVGTSTSPFPTSLGGFSNGLIDLSGIGTSTTISNGSTIATGTLPVLIAGFKTASGSSLPPYPAKGASQVYGHPVASSSLPIPFLAGELVVASITTGGTAFEDVHVIPGGEGDDTGITGNTNTFAGTFNLFYCEI